MIEIFLLTLIGNGFNLLGWNGTDARPAGIPTVEAKGYYYLWSLERIAVLLGVETKRRALSDTISGPPRG